MATRGTGGPFDPDLLLAEFRLYDRTVDVVSAYHWFFTETKEMPTTVEHFERYPLIEHPDGKKATPDFSVLFKDGRGIVAEVANIALHDNSVDKLCAQLLRYDRLTHLPSPTGPVEASSIDVLFLTPMDNAEAAANRVYRERLCDPEHEFTPSRPPVMVQFGLISDKYVFQKWPDGSINGTLTPGVSNHDYAKFRESLNIQPHMFDQNKVKYAFVNDPIKPLYLATRLWTSIFPSQFAVEEFTTTTTDVTRVLQEQYGRGCRQEVKAAMDVLVAARLAIDEQKGTWRVRRNKNLRGRGDQIAEAIADMVGKGKEPDSPAPRRGRQRTIEDEATLFDFL